MSNYPEDCKFKQTPWDESEEIECSQCNHLLDDDELEAGVCCECSSLDFND